MSEDLTEGFVCSNLSDDLSGLSIKEIEILKVSENSVKIDIKAASLNFPDLLMTQGKYQNKPNLPFALGMEGSGVISHLGSKVKNYKEQPLSETMKKLEPEDLIKYGLIPEFIGRMPIIATLDDLDEKSLVKILKEPKNSLIKQYQRLFEFEEVELEFKDEAILEIAKKAISKKTGARGLRSILENILLKTMFELPDLENVIKVTVDNAAVKGSSEPIITYGKKSSTSVA